MREQLMKQLEEAEKVHAKNSGAYRKALAKRADADAEVRKTCDVAHETANVLVAIKKAVASLPAEPPKLEAVE